MDEIRYVRCDEEFARDVSPKLLSEFITFDGAIPDDLSSVLRGNNHVYRHEREVFINAHLYIDTEMHAARAELDQFDNMVDICNYETDRVIEFINKNPQFKPLIDHIEFTERNENRERIIIKKVPIDQYLEEYVN